MGTTAIVRAEAGAPTPATEIPTYAAVEREGKANVFVAEKGIARSLTVMVVGERADKLYVDPTALPAGTQVVIEGRAQMTDGERVEVSVEPIAPSTPVDAGAGTRGGGFGRPL